MAKQRKYATREEAMAVSKQNLVPVKKGQVLNPSGRPKGLKGITETFREITTRKEVIEMVTELLTHKEPMIRLRAWEACMTRAWGAPIQGVMLKMLTGDEEIPQIPVIGEDGQPIVPEGGEQPTQGAQRFIFDPDDPEQRRRALEVGRLIEALGRQQPKSSVDVEYSKTTNGKANGKG